MKREVVKMKTDRPIPKAWDGDTEKVSFTMIKETIKERDFAEIWEVWKVFYNETLQTNNERDIMRDILTDKLCSCDKDFDKELERMNKLAKATKGNLHK